MRIGLYVSGEPSVEGAVERVRAAAGAGLDSVYFSQIFGWDALTVVALAGHQVPGIDLGTAVVQTQPRHPVALAGQALTTQAATGNRLTLGVGPSHRALIEGSFGLSYDRPARHVREYLEVLLPLLRGEQADHRGEALRVTARIEAAGAEPPPVLLSALGPVMLGIAGELADGTVTTWATPPVIADHVKPRLDAAATAAGRPAPRIVCGVTVSVTDRPEAVRREVAEAMRGVSDLPAYRALLDRQKLSGVHETALIGDEDEVVAGLRAFAEAGTTEVLAGIAGDPAEYARTLALLADLRRV
ncbi:TIGR03564 family F420-dependent LLM class oxidoreductase [Streptomyces sp. CA-111067]|uniref:TIGR03564 family F420-dependent LLM class oxidoreductase n=1 Tax=Streptomyces sp. CA-111067 TaxID=3240046 RepID=UPI003D98FD2C